MKHSAARLSVGGLSRFSTVDYPGKLAAVVFCQGCALHCGYCHNPHLQARLSPGAGLEWRDVAAFLEGRRGMLDAVVFSGGEALLQRSLPAAAAEAAALGFAVGLHTAGLSPKNLHRALPALSWVGFDVKAPFDAYHHVGAARAGRLVQRSLENLLASGVDHEVRMTICAPEVGRRAVLWAMSALPAMGVKRFALQQARRPGGALQFFDDDGVFSDAGLIEAVSAAFDQTVIRRYERAAAAA